MLYEKGRRHTVSFTLNDTPVSGEAEPRMLLTDFLRHEIGLTGTHVGCEHGVCGACTIQIDGEPARACLTYALRMEGREVRTVEALADDDDALSPLQQAFRRNHALQCGFCTAGILMTLDAWLKTHPNPTEQEVRETLSGNLCRCTGYAAIVRAVMDFVREGRHA
jgi:2-furoyl-CoA dehydrogenase 2Fe-2S iron sulfur subunit